MIPDLKVKDGKVIPKKQSFFDPIVVNDFYNDFFGKKSLVKPIKKARVTNKKPVKQNIVTPIDELINKYKD